MDEYSALRDAPFSAAELEELTNDMCEPRIAEVNSREPELRSGRTLRGAKYAKLPPRIEQHYSPLAGHVMQLFKQHKAGVTDVAAELVFILRCLKLAESRCDSYLPDVLEELKFRGDDDVELVASGPGSVSVGKAKDDVIKVEEYIIDCLIIGETKPDPKKLDALAAKSVKVKAELEVEAVPSTAVLVSQSPPPHKSQDEDEKGPLWDIDPEFYEIVGKEVRFDSGDRLETIKLGAVSVELKYPTPVEVEAFFSRFRGSSKLLSLNVILEKSSPAIEMNLADLPNLRRLGVFIDDGDHEEDTPQEEIERLSQQLLTALLESALPRLTWVHLYGWQFIPESIAMLGDSLVPRLKKLDVERSEFPYQSLDRLTKGSANSWARLKELSFIDSEVDRDGYLELAQILPAAERCPNLRSLGVENEDAMHGGGRGNDGPALITAIESGYWKDLEVLGCSIDIDEGEDVLKSDEDDEEVTESHVANAAIKHGAWPKLRKLANAENAKGKRKVLKQAFPNVDLDASVFVSNYIGYLSENRSL